MDIIVFSFFTALGFLLVLCRTLGFKRVMRWRKVLDVITTFGLPVLLIGTFSGMMTAFFTGLWFTGMTWLLNLATTTTTTLPFSYEGSQNNTNNANSNCSSRSGRD